MKNLLKTLHLKDAKHHHYILTALLAIFVVFPISLPEALAEMVNTIFGKVIVIVIYNAPNGWSPWVISSV